MATKKPVQESSESASKQMTKPVVTTEPLQPPAPSKPISPLWWIFGTLLSVVVLIFILGAVKHAMYAYKYDNYQDMRSGHMYNRSFDRGDMRESLRDNRTGSFVTGVVTVIDGDTLTIAGNGTTKQVKATDSTEFYGAAQSVKVNDSVRIVGTTQGDTFTATRVMISRQ
jgi:hypothetical protein